MDKYTQQRLQKALDIVNVLHKLANPACDTPEQAEKARIIWDAVKEALGEHSYADILSARTSLELLIEGQ
jgi:hypothetical protein